MALRLCVRERRGREKREDAGENTRVQNLVDSNNVYFDDFT